MRRLPTPRFLGIAGNAGNGINADQRWQGRLFGAAAFVVKGPGKDHSDLRIGSCSGAHVRPGTESATDGALPFRPRWITLYASFRTWKARPCRSILALCTGCRNDCSGMLISRHVPVLPWAFPTTSKPQALYYSEGRLPAAFSFAP